MKIPKILPSAVLLGAVSLSLAGAPRSSGQTTAATDPVGFTTASLPANSDSLISIPFTRPAAFSGTISSISGNTITVAASPSWTANQYVYVSGTQPNTYYAIVGPNIAPVTGTLSATNGSTAVTGAGSAFTQLVAGDEIIINGTAATVASVTSTTSLTLVSPFIGTTVTGASATFDHSPREGSYYTVTANGTNSLTVNLNGDSLASIAGNLGNTTVTLIPYWTLGTAFPASDAGVSFTASANVKSRGTQILMPDLTTAGINLSSPVAYYFLSGNWHSTNDGPTVPYDDTVLLPTTYFTVRNSTSTTTFTPSGSVYMNRISVALDSSTTSPQDTAVAINRPAGVALNDTGLISSGAFTPGTSAKSRGDLLLTYDNSATGINKSSPVAYYYLTGTGGGWRSTNDAPTVDYGTTVLPYGVGYVVRKGVSSTGTTAFWQNTRNY